MASSPETPNTGDGNVSAPTGSSPPASPPPPESSPPPPAPDSPPPADLTPPSPAPPAPEAQPPPAPPAPVSDPATPSVPVSPPVDAPPGDPVTPPAPDVPDSPPRQKHHGSPRSSPKEDSSPSSSKSSSSSGNNEMPVILGIIFGGLLALILIFLLLKWWNKKKRQQHYLEKGFPTKGDPYYQQKMGADPNAKFPHSPSMGGYLVPSSEFNSGQYGIPSPNKMMGSYGAKSEFSYEALAAATGNFSPSNVIGQGGFGFVHKGVLPDGTVVAVKSLKAGSGQGEREFQAEVEIISRVHHRYLVSLVGYCIAGAQRMLVYEFVSNNTLEHHLHGKGLPVMDWAVRRRIAVGSAKGLAYLHEDCHPRIIHRDIKAANILLEDSFEAKVADFGLAKLSTDNFTHVSTRVMGTFGYLAPEYAASGKLTEKSDVFSFGVMLLELITGRRPIDPTQIMEDSLVDWARPLMTKGIETGDYSELVDPRLEDNYNPTEMARMIACASASIRHSARKRPRMSQIVRILDGNASLDELNLNEGAKTVEPGRYDTREYNADIMKFRQMVLNNETEDFSSGPGPSPGSSGADSREMGLTGPLHKPNE